MSAEHIMTVLGTIIMILLGIIAFFAQTAYNRFVEKLDVIIDQMARLAERGSAAEDHIDRHEQELQSLKSTAQQHSDRLARIEGERHARDRL